MDTPSLIISGTKLGLARERFVSRQNFFKRCIDDIGGDFHKQYGPFEKDWLATYDACVVFMEHLEEYLCDRDVLEIEGKLLLGVIEKSQTKYTTVKAQKRYTEIIALCTEADESTLKDIDTHITDVRNVYKMIAYQEELG